MSGSDKAAFSARCRGAAMMLVLFAVAIASILALSFLRSQGPTAAIAANIDRHAEARALAESGLKLAIKYVKENEDWRTAMSNGLWLEDQGLSGGVFSVYGTDEDGDLADDLTDSVLLSVVATVNGRTHRVSALVTPGAEAPFPLPAHHWKLDETTGTAIVDSVGGLDGTNNNATLAQTGRDGNAIDFDGTSQHIEVPHDDALLLGNGTVSFWFQAGDTSGHQAMFSKDSSGYDTGGHVHIYLNGSTLTVRLQNTSTTYTLTSSTSVSSGQWYHAAFVFGDTGMSLYLNGVKVDTDAYAGGLGTTSGGAGNYEPMVFGYGTWGSGNLLKTPLSYAYHGLLDDIRIYDVGLNDQQVLLLYDPDADVNPAPKLLVQYEFDQVSVAPTLAGRWRLDEANAIGALATSGQIEMNSGSYVDSYDSSVGAYGGANTGSDAVVTTNSNSSGMISGGTIYGDAYAGPSGTPSSVITSSVTGSKDNLGASLSMPSYSAPSGSYSNMGSKTYSGGSTTWSSDLEFDDLVVTNSATITVSGSVTIHATKKFEMDNGASIVISPGASLTVFVGEDLIVKNGATLGTSDQAGAIRVVQYNGGYKTEFDDAEVSGLIESESEVTLKTGTQAYGALLASNDIYLFDGSDMHVDTSLAAVSLDVSPSSAEDSTPLANHGTPTNGPVGGVAGQHGTAFEFDGVDDYVEIPHHDSYLMQAGTFSVWFKTDAIISGKQGLFSKDSTSYDTGGHFSVYVEGSQVRVRMQDTAASYWVESASGSVTADTWYHIMFAWGEEGMALYLNGVLVDTNAYTGGLGTTSGGTGNYEPIVLGGNAWQSDDLVATPVKDFFNGVLDDLRIFNERLSESQAVEIFNGASEPSPFLSEVIVEDTSGFGNPLDLAVADPDNVTWGSGTLTFDTATVVQSLGDAAKLSNAIVATGEFSIVLRLTRASPGSTANPSRIVSMSGSSGSRNFTVGQEDMAIDVRVQTTVTGINGILSPNYQTGDLLTSDTPVHVVVTYDGETLKTYVNGSLEKSQALDGVFSGWDASMSLLIGNEVGGGRAWLGTIDELAIYDQALAVSQTGELSDGDAITNSETIVIWKEQH